MAGSACAFVHGPERLAAPYIRFFSNPWLMDDCFAVPSGVDGLYYSLLTKTMIIFTLLTKRAATGVSLLHS